MTWGFIFLTFGVFWFYCHLSFIFGGSNTRAWESQLGIVAWWDRGASRTVKSQLPSIGFGHIWGTTHGPSSMWKQSAASLFDTLHEMRPRLVSSFVISCFHWDHTDFSGIFLFNFLCTRSSSLLRTSISSANRGYSVIAVQCFSILCFSWADHRL